MKQAFRASTAAQNRAEATKRLLGLNIFLDCLLIILSIAVRASDDTIYNLKRTFDTTTSSVESWLSILFVLCAISAGVSIAAYIYFRTKCVVLMNSYITVEEGKVSGNALAEGQKGLDHFSIQMEDIANVAVVGMKGINLMITSKYGKDYPCYEIEGAYAAVNLINELRTAKKEKPEAEKNEKPSQSVPVARNTVSTGSLEDKFGIDII